MQKYQSCHFFDLPLEIRNQIYGLCLTVKTCLHLDGQADGVWLRSGRKGRRTVARRISLAIYWQRDSADQNSTSWEDWGIGPVTAALIELETIHINLVQVCQQIYVEASKVLYGQRFVFRDAKAISPFISQLSRQAVGSLRTIQVRSWEESRSHRYGREAMMMLGAKGAFKLHRMHFDCRLGSFGHDHSNEPARPESVPIRVARKIYRDCFYFFDQVIRHKIPPGPTTAEALSELVNIVKVNKSNFKNAVGFKTNFGEVDRLFKKELQRLILEDNDPE